MGSEQENVQVVQGMFAAFGQGDISAVLDLVAKDVDWQSPVRRAEPGEISWAKPCHSREEVALYFKKLVEKVQPEKMEVFEFTAQGNRVVVEGMNRGTVKATGRAYEHDWVMVFTMAGGKIVRHRHYYDTADILAAF